MPHAPDAYLVASIATHLGDDLSEGVHGGLVLDGLAGRHHHATTHSVDGVGGEAGHDGDGPAQQEGRQEVALQRTRDEHGLERVVHAEVQAAVDEDAHR